ncbi:hypothetical protein [uncultured Psychroserpens sp.]|uniref:hypothetical protein n=1 Tax=uncultured Psychroserpens sp. TaxID=255436 RepID=UPI00261B8B31|nr:hypothetical protein [uncultured Psychroserpens sp.]
MSIGNLFNELPNDNFFIITDYLILGLISLIILGVKTRVSFILLATLLIINNAFAYGFGKIDHTFLFILFLYLCAFLNLGTRRAILKDEPNKNCDWYVTIYSLLIVFAFFTAGYEKLINWFDFNFGTSGILSWFYSGYFNLGRNKLLAPYFFNIPIWIKELMDYSAVIFEMCGIFFLLYSRKSWRIYLVIAILFHLINTLVLNISFRLHLIIYGLWIFTTVLKKNKLFIFLLIPFLFKGQLATVIQWNLFLYIGIYSLRILPKDNKLKG